MSTVTTAATPLERIANDPYCLRQFSVAEYYRMVETGILTTNDRVELLEGWIVNKGRQSPPHASSLTRLNWHILRFLPDNWTMQVRAAITLSNSAPEPDIALTRGEVSVYDSRHPEAADVGALIEVADSTELDDRRYKGELYAKAKIREFWLINLVERIIEVYTRPRGGKYQKKVEYSVNDTVPLVLDGVKIADIPVRELIPKS